MRYSRKQMGVTMATAVRSTGGVLAVMIGVYTVVLAVIASL